MLTMQNLIPISLAVLGIATIFYTWRDFYIPGVRKLEMLQERAAMRMHFVSHYSLDDPR